MYQVGMSTPLSVSVPPTKLSVSGTAEQLIKIKLNKYIRLLSSRSIAVMANTYHTETCHYGHGCLQKRLGNVLGETAWCASVSRASFRHVYGAFGKHGCFYLTVSNWCTMEHAYSIKGTLMRSCVMTETVPLKQKRYTNFFTVHLCTPNWLAMMRQSCPICTGL